MTATTRLSASGIKAMARSFLAKTDEEEAGHS